MLGFGLGDRAELRALEPWQAAEFAAHVDRARAHLAPWLPWASVVVDEDSARAFLQRYADEQEIGVWLDPEAQGRGLVTRACRGLIDWAIDVRGMARVEWRCVPHNARSVAAAKRLGMRRDGVLREAFPMAGVRYDVEVWSVLASARSPRLS